MILFFVLEDGIYVNMWIVFVCNKYKEILIKMFFVYKYELFIRYIIVIKFKYVFLL